MVCIILNYVFHEKVNLLISFNKIHLYIIINIKPNAFLLSSSHLYTPYPSLPFLSLLYIFLDKTLYFKFKCCRYLNCLGKVNKQFS